MDSSTVLNPGIKKAYKGCVKYYTYCSAYCRPFFFKRIQKVTSEADVFLYACGNMVVFIDFNCNVYILVATPSLRIANKYKPGRLHF